jgi:prepilin-type N-terminal cleavage/methylation domain-containing protein
MKKGFTLMEILVVLGIIVMLATIGLGIFAGSRRSLTVDLETDKLVAAFHALRGEAQTKAKCFGVVFEPNKPPQKIVSAYLNRLQGCSANENQSALPWEKEIVISGLALDGGSKNELKVWFVPPNGKLKLNPEGAVGEITLAIASPTAISRKILLRTATGVIEKK